MSKLLSFKQRTPQPDPVALRWQMGIDKRQVILYIFIALITGFTLGFWFAQMSGKTQPPIITESMDGATSVKASEHTANSFRAVTRIVRGDTVEVEGIGVVRLIGVETPDGKSQYIEHGKKAREFVESSLKGRKVRIEFDQTSASSSQRDASGNTLGYVYLQDGTLLNKELLDRGLAFLRTGDLFSRIDEFRASEGEAMQSMRGLWGSDGNSTKTASDKSDAKESDKSKKTAALPPSEIGPNLPTSTSVVPGEPTVFVSGADRIYHKDGCELLDKKKTAMSLSHAKSSGHTACGRCFASTVLKAR